MKNKEIYDLTDAFLALNEIDDEEVKGMLDEKQKELAKRRRTRKVNEGKEYSLLAGQSELDDARNFINQDLGEAQIEVIDVDANTEEHLKNKEDYVGQAILRCKRCMTNKFINLEDLKADEDDPDTYNIEDECPHCHISGEGFDLIGQVGKVEEPKLEEEPKEEEEPEEVEAPEEAEEEEPEEVTFEAEPEAEEGEEEAEPKFDNDDEGPEEEKTADEDEEAGEEDEEELPNLEDFDNEEKDEEEEDKKEKKESLKENIDVAPKMNLVFTDRDWWVGELLNDAALTKAAERMGITLEYLDKFEARFPRARFFEYRDLYNDEIYLLAFDGDKQLAIDARGQEFPDIAYFGAPDVRDLVTSIDDEHLTEDLDDEYLSDQAKDALMMDKVMSAMNNEEAYYDAWLYVWPEDTDESDVEIYFGSSDVDNEEDYNSLKNTYLETYKRYHGDGLFEADEETLAYAHKTDALLHLSPIENHVTEKAPVKETLEVSNLADVLNAIAEPEKIKTVEFVDVSKDASRKLYEGVYEEAPFGLTGCPCRGFDTANHPLTCNIDSEADQDLNKRTLRDALDKFEDDDTDKVHV